MAEFGSSEAGKKGGKARAKKLTDEQRKEIASLGAQARWAGKARANAVRQATHMGEIQIGEIILPCAVLEDGTRVISQRGMSKGLGRVTTGSGTHYSRNDNGVARLPTFLSGRNIKELVPEDLAASLLQPIEYLPLHGGRTAHGFPANLVPNICDVWLMARDAGVLQASQKHIADRAYMLMRGLAHVGIIALVDEATGYQEVRARDELSKILEAYISPELMPWTKMFPDVFFKEIYRLQGWEYRPGSTRRTPYVGKLINKYVYEQLPPGVLDELRRLNPVTESGYRKRKHFQLLTADTGNPHLDRQITAVTTILRISDDQYEFKHNFERAFPKDQLQLRLPLRVELDPE